MMKEYVLAN